MKSRIFIYLLGIFLVTGCSPNVDQAYEALKFPKEPEKEVLYDTSLINKESQWGTLNGHDPSIFKEEDTYYTVSTDVKVGGSPFPGIQIRKSDDLIEWEYVGTALDSIPQEAYEWTGANELWAPDLIKMNDKYYMYYSASTFGSNQSWIGLLTSESIDGPWEDEGVVIKSATEDEHNAIDPAVSFDRDGNLWMTYGSFFGGIYIIQLDKETGKPLDDDIGSVIAKRNDSVSNAVEGPYIIYNESVDKYFLFVSYDSLSADYNIRVARSDNIDGPYVDYTGNKMTDTDVFPYEVGTKIMGSYRFGTSDGWIAPGHNSVLNDDGDFYLIHHARGEQDPNWPYLHVRKIVWTDDDWPLVSPERYTGEEEQTIPEEAIIGDWKYIYLSKYNNDLIPSEDVVFANKGKVENNDKVKQWNYSDDNQLTLTYEDGDEAHSITGQVMVAWDWDNWKTTIVFTGIDESGTTFWAKKYHE